MINNANKYTVSDIFGPDHKVKYVIPKYQREYTWGKENWDDLLNDIWDADVNHFIGSIIGIRQIENDMLEIQELEVIDGQQRLTTISLLYAALYKLLKEKGDSSDEDLMLELGNLKWRLIQKLNKQELKLELSMQNNNFQDYKAVLAEIGIRDFAEENKNKGNRLIFKAFRFYNSRLDEFTVADLSKLLSKLNAVMLVKIEVDSHSDAFMLFESLNNRGIPLSPIDLIKNKILSVLEKKDIPIDESFEKWKQLIGNLIDYKIQDRFLRQYYNAFKINDKIKIEGITKATRSNIIKIYESLIDKDVEFIFNDLLSKSAIYNSFHEENDNEIFSNLKEEFRDLTNVGATPAYTLLLYLFAKSPRKDLDFYKKILKFLINYFVRRSLTDFPNTRNLDQIFMNLIEELEQDNSKLTVDYIQHFLKLPDNFATDEMFENKLRGNLYDTNVDVTRFILSKIEESKSFTKEKYTDFWQRDKSNKLIWTIEHIFPEGENIPEDWVKMIADGNVEKAREIREKLVHKLGNLTLTGFNQNLSNFSLEKKRDRQDVNGKNIGYKNGLFLNDDLKERTKWSEEDILTRQEKLIAIALELFNI